MNQEVLDNITEYFLKNRKTCTLVGEKTERDSIIDELKKVNSNVVCVSLEQGQSADDLPLEKVWKFWRAVVREYKSVIPADSLKDDQEKVEAAYDFFEQDYDSKTMWQKYFLRYKERSGMDSGKLLQNIVQKNMIRKVDGMIFWITHCFKTWSGEDAVKLNEKLHILVEEQLDIVGKIKEFSGIAAIEQCIELFATEKKEVVIGMEESKKHIVKIADFMGKLRDYLMEYEREKLTAISGLDKELFMNEMKNQSIEFYDALAKDYFDDLREAYESNNCQLWLVISDFEKTALYYPESDNTADFYRRLFGLSQKMGDTPPDIIMLACDRETDAYVQHWENEGSRFADGYPAEW